MGEILQGSNCIYCVRRAKRSDSGVRSTGASIFIFSNPPFLPTNKAKEELLKYNDPMFQVRYLL